MYNYEKFENAVQNRYIKEDKGITLVALIISIIVLLILATVSISLVINNGILDKAKSTVDKYSDGENEQQINLAYQEYQMAKYTGTDMSDIEYMIDSLEKTYGDNNVTITKEDETYIVTLKINNINKNYYLNNGQTGIYKTVEDYGVQIGDYISYDCYTGVKSDDLYYKSLSTLNGDSDQEFEVTENDKTRKWRVLETNSTGNLMITTADPIQTKTGNNYTLKGKAGYVNGPDELNNISKIYGHGLGAVDSRSIKVEDVNKITGQHLNDTFAKYTYTKNADDGKIYLNNVEKSNATIFLYYENNNPKGEWKQLKSGETSPEIENTYYSYNIGTTTKTLKLIRYNDDETTNASYWLASRAEYCQSIALRYLVQYVAEGSLRNYYLGIFESSGGSHTRSNGVRPVIVLDSNIKFTGSSENGWEIN